MRFTLILFLVFIIYPVNAQKTDPIEVLYSFFDAFHEKDSIKLKKMLSADAKMYRIGNNRMGTPVRKRASVPHFISAVASRPASPVWEERLGRPIVHQDQNLAVIWVPFKFFIDKKLIHCGINMFTLFWDGNNWVITELSDTNSKNCKNI